MKMLNVFSTNLKQINKKLWDIEDNIRDKEKYETFDGKFIELARNVYITNDERSRIKRNINKTFASEFIERNHTLIINLNIKIL